MENQGQKILKMCVARKNYKCKESNYAYLKHCASSFHWVVFAMIGGALFLLFAASYSIVRIFDGNWSDWKLPAVMGISYLAIVGILAMFFSLKTIKQEMTSEFEFATSEENI